MKNKQELLEKTRLFVLDMDGTFYLGGRILSGSLDFLEQVERLGKQYLFFTNNSSDSADNYIQKLAKMGCSITRDQIMTSGDVTAAYLLKHHPGEKYICSEHLPWRKIFRNTAFRWSKTKRILLLLDLTKRLIMIN